MGATFYNDGAVPLTDIIACIGDYKGGAGNTPGIYPTATNSVLTGPLGGAFALTHEGGSSGLADATRYIASIPAGGSVTIYWLVSYPQLDVNGIPTWGTSVKPDDDLRLQFDVWATASEGGTPRSVDATRTVTLRNEISASANKIFPSTANKVPAYYQQLFNQYVPAWTNVSADGTVGTRIMTEGVWYDFGNVGDGFDNNGDLIPDHNAWMQPVGDPSLFDAGAFRLIHTYAYLVVKLKSGGEQVLSGEDQLYFENIPDNNGVVGYVRYEFMPLLAGARSVTTPYQEVASGYDNEKFNADYGVSLGQDLVSGPSKALIDKSANKDTVALGGAIQYTVAYTNSGTVAVGVPDEGVPLVIQDSVPAGRVYVAGSATSSNTLPSGVTAYHVLYSTNGISWTTTEPSPASSVKHIQWWLNDALAAGAAGIVRFSVTVSSSYSLPTPWIDNVAGLSFGNTAPFATDDATTRVIGVNALGDTVFADTGIGVGGYYGNGLQDGAEPGLSGIDVNIYYDADGDGVLDAGEALVGTAITGTNGVYSFGNLLDGNYVAVVNSTDTSLPRGYTLTTPGTRAVALDPSGSNSSSVTVNTADFGFAPALLLDKGRIGSGNLREGQQVSYVLSVTNTLAGSGSATLQPAVYTAWPTNGTTGSGQKAWLNPTNCWGLGEPNGRYATGPYDNSGETLTLSGGYYIGTQLGNPTNVALVIPMVLSTNFPSGNTLQIIVRTNGVQIGTTRTIDCSTLSSGTLSYDITSYNSAWSWSVFNGSQLSVELTAGKTGNPNVEMFVDSVGFRVTTDRLVGGANVDTTLDPVPMFDTYDTARLRFLSASLSPDAIATNTGLGLLTWNNLGPIYAGGGRSVTVNFSVLQPPGNIAAPVTNAVAITNAFFLNGTPANQGEDLDIAQVLPAGTIGDRVWRDLDGDGSQDSGEPGVANVTVRLTPPTGVDLGAGTNQPITTVTDANGYYLFTSLPASGTYTVAVLASTLPGGAGVCTWDRDSTHDGTTGVPIVYDSTTGADTVTDADFGYQLASTIRGTLWHDFDRDAYTAPEDGEDRLSGVTVRLYAADGVTVLATTNTSAGGTFQFVGPYLTSGTYIVKADATTGPLGTNSWTRSYDSDGLASVNQVSVDVPAGGLGLADFSYYRTGTLEIGDTLFFDWDGDGVQDLNVDEGLNHIRVWLYQDENTNGVVDVGIDALVGETTTATNGLYMFAGLPPGTYQVIVDEADSDFPGHHLLTYDPNGPMDGVGVATLTTTNIMTQDFGYQPYGFASIGDTVWYDSNGDGVQLGAMELGISNVTVTLYADIDTDSSYLAVRTTTTDSSGKYLFDNLPVGDYRVAVATNSASLPVDNFGDISRPTTAISYTMHILDGEAYRNADFGFVLPGAVGDTVYWDNNGNGDQDWTEPGIPNVTVYLYADANTNGVYDPGENQVGTQVTDSAGKYIFDKLMPAHYVVVVDAFSAPLTGATLTADPNNDGDPCPVPAVSGPSCDGQYGVLVVEESTIRSADFGYQPPGVIGDLLWLDLNANGAFDVGEQGIPYVTIALYAGANLVATNVTDSDGYYTFGNLTNGTYRVNVLTNDTDFPAGLAATYDADGTPDGVANTLKIVNGHISEINGASVTNADLTIDFGYKYAGNNSLSGTVGLDVAPYDGVLNGTSPSGTGSGEFPFAGVSVYLYLWNDTGNNAVDAGEVTPISSALTGPNGDYSFTGLPNGDGNDRYIVTLMAPAADLKLTTTNGNTTALWVSNTVNAVGMTVSASQAVTIIPSRDNIDFAFKGTKLLDFGDLPESYSTVMGNQPIGASHTVLTNQILRFGSGISSELNGQPTVNATGDSYDDGVVAVGRWRDGVDGGAVTVTVGAGSGWLEGWIDFNQDGTFTNANEHVFNQAVFSTTNSGIYNLSFDIPAGTFLTNSATVLNSRFRLYPSEPQLPTYFGTATGGEVEDYQFVFGVIGNFVWDDKNGNGLQDVGEGGVSNVIVRLYDAATNLLETVATAADGSYAFTGLPTNAYTVVFTKPDGTFFTVQGAGDALLNSDANVQTGSSGAVSLSADASRIDIDAGLYVPAVLYGYTFKDKTQDMLRNSGDAYITNMLVRLLINGTNYASTSTDVIGYYQFTNVPPGDVTLVVSKGGGILSGVPGEGEAATDERRNRALDSEFDDEAYILYSVTSGYGVLASNPAEQLNFGFEALPLSTAIDLKARADGNGGVLIDIWTANESGYGDIVVYAWIGNAWVEVGRVPGSQVIGEGSNRYTVRSTVLPPEGSYYFRVVDEAGHVHDSPVPVAVSVITLSALRFEMQTAVISFNTEYGCRYQVKVCDKLGAGADAWAAEYVSVLRDGAWAAYSNQPFAAGPGTQTQVRVPVNRQNAFFKIVLIQE